MDYQCLARLAFRPVYTWSAAETCFCSGPGGRETEPGSTVMNEAGNGCVTVTGTLIKEPAYIVTCYQTY